MQIFLDLEGAKSLTHGLESHEMVIRCDYLRVGVKGLFPVEISFMPPTCVVTGIIAYLCTQVY